MLALLRTYAMRHQLEQPLRSFVAELIATRSPVESPPTHTSVGDATALIEPLTPREREILNLTAIGLSNQEIANMLVIGVGTVKTNLHNLYGKLDARDRMDAVVCVRSLGLVG